MQGKVSLERSAATRVYVGIDVCKAWLDIHVHPTGQSFRVPNTPHGLKQLKRRLAKVDVALITMEATGKFHRQAHRNLHASGFAVAVVNPLRSRLFAEAIGMLAKTDAVDARMLALLAATIEPKAKAPPPETLENLQEIVRGREACVAQRTALLNQLGTAKTTCLRQQIRHQLKTVERAVEGCKPRSSASSRPTRRSPGALPSSPRSQASATSPLSPCWRTSPSSARARANRLP